MVYYLLIFFFFNDTATTEIYTLSLHDALPISRRRAQGRHPHLPHGLSPLLQRRGGGGRGALFPAPSRRRSGVRRVDRDRKSTRLNSSHANISYAVFCLKKKKKYKIIERLQNM